MHYRKNIEYPYLRVYDQSYSLIVTAFEDELQNVIRDFKKFTSTKLVEATQEHPESRREWHSRKFSYEAKKSGKTKHYKVWKDGLHPVILNTLEKIEQTRKLHPS